VLLPLPENSYALTWQDLWQTKDQQAYQAYNKGDYDKAAKLFEDPAWQAAAQYKSKQSEIEQLKTPTSATGFYNQGNVLAKAGKYAEAIQAYDQALKQNPDKSVRDDALYNKKLVEEALKKQQEQKQDSQNSQDKNQKNKDQQKQKNKEQKDNKDNKSSQDKKDSKNDKSKKEQQKPENSENKKDQESKEAEDKQQQNQQNQQQKEQEKQQAAQAKKQQSEKEEQKAQAQQAQLQQDEKKRADDEWLKRIPDDPAGLLRRKFKYQYQQRQQQNTPTQNW
jgi:Ca-activated chloride channel family protein